MKLKLNDGTIVECESFEVVVAKKLPESWDELGKIKGSFIDADSSIDETVTVNISILHKNLWPTSELAEASLAMSQLAQLRERYWDGWEPAWGNGFLNKFIIYYSENKLITGTSFYSSHFLCFETEEKRDHFFEHHRDLIEQAKPLL